jgi:hypothetical protein
VAASNPIAGQMNSTDHFAKNYFDAWNAHDGGGLARLFDSGGTYVDPTAMMQVKAFELPS